ncbi:hypothetical protein GCM10029992_11860 [Glycomyces albus]
MSWTNPGGGLFVWATLPEGLDSKAMLPRALQERVAYVPGTGFYADGNGRREMRLNFSTQSSDSIREGVRRLAGVVAGDIELRDTFSGVRHERNRRRGSVGPAGPDPRRRHVVRARGVPQVRTPGCGRAAAPGHGLRDPRP